MESKGNEQKSVPIEKYTRDDASLKPTADRNREKRKKGKGRTQSEVQARSSK